MTVITASLFLDLRSEAPAGPGWYVFGSLKPDAAVEVAPEAALEILEAFNRILRPGTVEPRTLLTTGNQEIAAELHKQLEFAENQASRIAMLRKRLANTAPVAEEGYAQGLEDRRSDL